MGRSKRERRERKWGPPGYYEHVTGRPCVVNNADCGGRIEFCHGHGHGGQDYTSGWPGCSNHHTRRGDSFHRLGVESFQKRHGVNVAAVAAMIFREWEGDEW